MKMAFVKRIACSGDSNTLSKFFVYFFFSSCCVTSIMASNIVVESPFGKIQGVRKVDENTGLSYLSFKGIPYAKPPLGDLRFAKPQPHPKIGGVFDATKDAPILCPHPNEFTFGMTGFTEDCLILNIQAKDIDASGHLRRVIVYIHGGAFHWGAGVIHDSKSFVISQDVIVVTINYRLNVFGFLSMENEAGPGNYGLWDQTLAIKWVKDNIGAFGGDPHDITIAGESAGATSVGYQAISPQAKGLFTRVFALSGGVTSVYSQAVNAQSHALAFAKCFGCWKDDIYSKIGIQESRSVIDCLRKLPLSRIATYPTFNMTETQFVPRVDFDFVPDAPAQLLSDDKYLESIGFFDVTYLVSIVNNEVGVGHNLVKWAKDEIYKNDKLTLDEQETAFTHLVTRFKRLYLNTMAPGQTPENVDLIMNRVNDFYETRYSPEDVNGKFMIDLDSIMPCMDLVRTASRRDSCNSYLLYFNYFPRFIKGSIKGVPHEADLAFWFDIDLNYVEAYVLAGIKPELFDDDDREIKRMFLSIIGEFARSGNPGHALRGTLGCSWPKYDACDSNYLNFNLNPYVGSFLKKETTDFWHKTFPSLVKSNNGS